MTPRARSRVVMFTLVTVAAAALGLAAGRLWLAPGGGSAVIGQPVSTGTATIGGPFSLVDQSGTLRRLADWRGKYLLMFFGYTHCPDFCPTGLQSMAQAIDEMGADGDAVVPVFITIDPARDTPALLAEYVPLFHPRLVGLTGTDDQVAAAAQAWRVYYARSEGSGSGDEDYLMDHSTIIYLVDPEGRYLSHFRHGTDPAEMAEGIRSLM